MMKRIRLIRLILVTTVLLALVSGCVLPTEAPPSRTTPEPTQSAGTTGTQRITLFGEANKRSAIFVCSCG